MMTERALKGQRPRIHGDGKRPVDLTFITDAVDAIRRCADCPDLKGRPLNICSGGTTTMNQIAIAILEAAGRPGGEPEWLPELPDETLQILGDNTLAKELLGWEPKVLIRQGIGEFVEWYKMNRSPIV
jgi:nucleoside-diphosphate-sugar epimerase